MHVENSGKSYGEIVAVFKSLQSFKHMLEKDGYVLPDLIDLSWEYVMSIAGGQKKLLKHNEIPNFTLPIRFSN